MAAPEPGSRRTADVALRLKVSAGTCPLRQLAAHEPKPQPSPSAGVTP